MEYRLRERAMTIFSLTCLTFYEFIKKIYRWIHSESKVSSSFITNILNSFVYVGFKRPHTIFCTVISSEICSTLRHLPFWVYEALSLARGAELCKFWMWAPFFFNTATPHMARVPPVLISPPQYSALTSQMETRRTTRPTMQRFDLSVSVYCVREFVLSLQHTVYTQSPRLERIPFYI